MASAKTWIGYTSARSVTPSNAPRPTSAAASSSAAAEKSARRLSATFGVMRWSIGLRTTEWAGGSASSNRLGGRQGGSLRKSASPTPAAEEYVSQSPRASATSAWRARAQTP